jgi:uncharacterized protein (TIGR02265 family)
MPTSTARLDLEARKGLARSGLTVRSILVQKVFEYVQEVAGEGATARFPGAPHAHAPFAEVSVDWFIDLLAAAIERVAPHGVTAHQLYEEIGLRSVLAIRDSTIGRTLVSMASGDPVRLFETLGSGPSILVAYGERKVLEVAPGRARIAFAGSLLPPQIFAGMYRAMAEGVGARGVQCVSLERTLGDTEHVVTWS